MTNEEMFTENIKIAYKIAQQYKNCEIEYEDLKQICLLALWKAVKTYKNNKGTAFSTYAYRVIQNEINQYLRNNRKYFYVKSISENITEDVTIEDTLTDNKNFIEVVETKIQCKKGLERIYSTIKKEKQRLIFDMYLNEHTQNEIAEKVGVSQAQVSRVIRKIHQIARGINL